MLTYCPGQVVTVLVEQNVLNGSCVSGSHDYWELPTRELHYRTDAE